MPNWPEQWYGRDLSPALANAVADEFADFGAVGVASGGPGRLAAVTILEHGNDAQKEKYLRRILTGEDMWCQLFSEPGSGSDLAGATTRADRDGDGWKVNGQKVWNTSAHHARYGLLVARTDWDLPKHQGLSYFILDMDQPGVTVKQLKQMNGHASFNEVFFTDAAIPPGEMLGNEGDGWQVAMTTLAHERRLGDVLRNAWRRRASGKAPIYDELRRGERGSAWRLIPGIRSVSRPGGPGHSPRPWRPVQDQRSRWSARRLPGCMIMAQNRGMDCAPGPRRSAAGKTPGPGRLSRQTGRQQRGQGCLPGAYHDHRQPMLLLTGPDSPENGIIAEILVVSLPAISIAGGYRRDPAQHHLRTGTGYGQGAEIRSGPVPRCAAELRTTHGDNRTPPGRYPGHRGRPAARRAVSPARCWATSAQR